MGGWLLGGQALLGLLVAGIFVLPFNFPTHTPPLASFYSEVLAFLLAFAALVVFLSRRERTLNLPPSVFLWLALMAWTAISPLFIDYVYSAQWLLPLGAFAAALAACLLGAQRPALAGSGFDLPAVVAAGLCIGGVWQSIAGWLQLIEWAHVAVPWIAFFGYDNSVSGNIGHQNVYGHAMAWSAMAALWLATSRIRGRAMQALAMLLAAWFVFAGTWSGSRAFLVFLVYWALLAAWACLRSSDKAVRAWGRGLLLLVVLGWSSQFFAQPFRSAINSAFNLDVQVYSAVEAIDRGNFGERRWAEIRKASRIFLDHPVTGVGWGGYPAESFELQALDEFKDSEESVLFIHAHNSPVQLAAELGILGVAVVLGLVVYLGRLFFRSKATEQFFVWSIIGVVLIHSLLEYPLWYVHFLVGSAFLLALVEPAKGVVLSGRARALGIGFGALSITGGILLTGAHYWLGARWLPEGTRPERDAVYNQLARAREIPLIDQWAESALVNHFRRTPEQAELRKSVIERHARTRPYYYVQAKLVCELGMAKEIGKRAFEYTRLIRAYPERKAELDNFFARYGC